MSLWHVHAGLVNSFGPSDAIWRWRSWSTLVQVMSCCLAAPSLYLNQWLIISKVLCHSSEDIIIRRFENTNQKSKIEDYIFKITLKSPRGQWVNSLVPVICASRDTVSVISKVWSSNHQQNSSLGTLCEIALGWVRQKIPNNTSTLSRVMAWCR